jgi:hypothetical protein
MQAPFAGCRQGKAAVQGRGVITASMRRSVGQLGATLPGAHRFGKCASLSTKRPAPESLVAAAPRPAAGGHGAALLHPPSTTATGAQLVAAAGTSLAPLDAGSNGIAEAARVDAQHHVALRRQAIRTDLVPSKYQPVSATPSTRWGGSGCDRLLVCGCFSDYRAASLHFVF